MTISAYQDIRAALEVRLSTVPSLPSVAWENTDFSPTTGTPYVKVRLVHTSKRPAVRFSDPQYKYRGIFQVLVYFPEGVGPAVSQAVVDSIVDKFQTGDSLNSNGVYVSIENSEQMGAYNNDTWYCTPVNINWHCFA